MANENELITVALKLPAWAVEALRRMESATGTKIDKYVGDALCDVLFDYQADAQDSGAVTREVMKLDKVKTAYLRWKGWQEEFAIRMEMSERVAQAKELCARRSIARWSRMKRCGGALDVERVPEEIAALVSRKRISVLSLFGKRRPAAGVYFVCSKGKIIYIGQSKNVYSRGLVLAAKVDVDAIYFTPCADANERLWLEAEWIDCVRPPLNRQRPDVFQWDTLSVVARPPQRQCDETNATEEP